MCLNMTARHRQRDFLTYRSAIIILLHRSMLTEYFLCSTTVPKKEEGGMLIPLYCPAVTRAVCAPGNNRGTAGEDAMAHPVTLKVAGLTDSGEFHTCWLGETAVSGYKVIID